MNAGGANPWVSGGQNEANRRVHAALLRANVDIITDLNPKIFHQKFIVRDRELATTATLTGSTNFTPTGTGSNLKDVVILRSTRISGLYSKEFEEL